MAQNTDFGSGGHSDQMGTAVPGTEPRPNALPRGVGIGGSLPGGSGTSTASTVKELQGCAAALAEGIGWARRNNARLAGALQRLRGNDIEQAEERPVPELQGVLPAISMSLSALDGALEEQQALIEQLEEIV